MKNPGEEDKTKGGAKNIYDLLDEWDRAYVELRRDSETEAAQRKKNAEEASGE